MFTTRLISGIVLVLIALVVVGSGGMILFAATVAISMIGLFELYRVMKIQKNVIGIAGYLTVVSYYGLLWFHGRRAVHDADVHCISYDTDDHLCLYVPQI